VIQRSSPNLENEFFGLQFISFARLFLKMLFITLFRFGYLHLLISFLRADCQRNSSSHLAIPRWHLTFAASCMHLLLIEIFSNSYSSFILNLVSSIIILSSSQALSGVQSWPLSESLVLDLMSPHGPSVCWRPWR
jgi:cellulose synthase/poly-beta-1,6-N-acetylglucosamine synthase-like glycosyltransferase